MKNIVTIYKKEILGYLKSPMAYIVAASFFTITGFFFVASVSDAFSEASIRGFLAGAVFFMIFLSPALTMRLIAEEQKLGTMELLMTSPLRDYEIVMGKFLAAFSLITIMIIGTFFYPLILFTFGVPDFGPIITGYLGLLLYSASTLSIGIFASSLSSNQLISLIVGSGILSFLTFINFFIPSCSSSPADCKRKTNGPALPSIIGTSGPSSLIMQLSIPRPAIAERRCSIV